MTGLWEIAFVIFLLSLTVLVYLLIPTISEFRRTLKRVNRALAILNDDLPDILRNVNDISETVNSASRKLEASVKDVVELEHLLSKEIKQPLQNIAQTIATILQLFNKVFHRKSSK
jgi:uncharacterized protein YoxC